jgi:hypothetical protein
MADVKHLERKVIRRLGLGQQHRKTRISAIFLEKKKIQKSRKKSHNNGHFATIVDRFGEILGVRMMRTSGFCMKNTSKQSIY